MDCNIEQFAGFTQITDNVGASDVVIIDVASTKTDTAETNIDVAQELPTYSQHQASSQRRQSSVSVIGPSLQFTGIGYSVYVKKTKSNLQILKNVSGLVRGGEMMYIMGPSGAGKSTMLDALAGRLKGEINGTLKIDGKSLSTNQLKQMAKYVQQEDVHIPVLTVEETLKYCALFYTTDTAEASQRAEDAIAILGLHKQRNTRVGNFLLRGLSGGQKRRLSVGVELVAKPRVLFLDEPTSGLDSTSAFSVVSSLKSICQKAGTTMVISIHQPAERLYLQGDSLLLLTGGCSAFCGPIKEAVPHFQSLGHTPPVMTSSSEFLLDLVNKDFATKPQDVDDLVNAWSFKSEDVNVMSSPVEADSHFQTGFLHQTWVLMKRMFLNSLRNPLVIWLRMGLYVMLSIMIGTVWLRIGANNPKTSVVQDLVGALFFIAAFMVFMSVSVLPAFAEEKNVFLRERANGSYMVASYNVAHLLVDIPFVALLAVVCGSITYWLVGFNNAGENFLYYLLDLFFSFMVAESLMILIASMVPDPIIGIAGGAMVYGAFMIVQGFFIKLDEIGWWWRWMHYIGLHSYSFAGFMINEFDGRVFGADASADGGPQPEMNGTQILDLYDVPRDLDKWENLVVLFAMTLIYRFLGFVHMYYVHRGKH